MEGNIKLVGLTAEVGEQEELKAIIKDVQYLAFRKGLAPIVRDPTNTPLDVKLWKIKKDF